MKGAYVLFIELKTDREIYVGRLGRIRFRKGFYAYVGSALGGVEQRVLRHLRSCKKRYWHVDYLLSEGKIIAVLCLSSERKEECILAEKFRSKHSFVPGFGCSDCGCPSHLFYSPNLGDLKTTMSNN
jgi:Uri superfamily endonuclease